jgi:hypothetical protein
LFDEENKTISIKNSGLCLDWFYLGNGLAFGPSLVYSAIFFASIKLRFGWFGLVWAELCSSHDLINILVSCIATLTLTRIILIVHILCIRYAHYIVCCPHSVLKHCALRLLVRCRSLFGCLISVFAVLILCSFASSLLSCLFAALILYRSLCSLCILSNPPDSFRLLARSAYTNRFAHVYLLKGYERAHAISCVCVMDLKVLKV